MAKKASRNPKRKAADENIDLNNPEFIKAWELIQHTRQSIFLTGKAGTGKSTFLRYITSHTHKKHVVLAPTGIAAVNVGGVTLHSFFRIPFKPIVPDDPDFLPDRIKQRMKYPGSLVKLIREVELIIIDEISMVRADIIDFVDLLLRTYSGNQREPFGGKQLLFVGDISSLNRFFQATCATSCENSIATRSSSQPACLSGCVLSRLNYAKSTVRARVIS